MNKQMKNCNKIIYFEHHNRGHHTIWLARGDSGYHPYDKLPDNLKKEWDISENVLIRLAADKYLYLVGSFRDTPDADRNFIVKRQKTLVMRRDTGCWTGVWGPCSSGKELHSILVSSLSERSGCVEGYLFVVSDKVLPGELLTRLIHARLDAKQISDACSGNLYCALEDGPDRDHFHLYCPKDNLKGVFDILKETLAEFDMMVKVSSESSA